MAEFTANGVQTVQPGGAVLFPDTAIAPNRSVFHREGSGIFTLKAITAPCQPFARFKISYGANITVAEGGTAGQISMTVAISGEPETSTTMLVVPAAVGNYFNISRETFINVPSGCCTTISVENTSTQAIDVMNANLIIDRVA